MGTTIEVRRVEGVELITVYYDFECSFCFRTISRVLNGCKDQVSLSTIQEIESDDHLFQGIPNHELYRYMWLIDTKIGVRHKGYFAFKYIYKHLHQSKVLRLIFSIPFFSDFFGVRIYRLIANNRRLAGCNSQACSLHGKKKSE
jgi:predicted DCC family thiol-disulfide oxidoreductase YuxK